MSTVIRNELSKKSKYWISKDRYLELKHYCLQYPEWKHALQSTAFCSAPPIHQVADDTFPSSKIEDIAEKREYYLDNMRLVERVAILTSDEFSEYLLLAVTQNYSCNYLITKLRMPCGKDKFYDMYRRFFWLLDKEKTVHR